MRSSGWSSVVCSSDLVCVKRFLGVPTDTLLAVLRRIETDSSRSLNTETVEYARDKGWINDWESSFLLDTKRKRKLSLRRSEEHTSELQSLMRISYAVFCLKKKNITDDTQTTYT